MASPEQDRDAFRTALDAALRERAELDSLIEFLSRRLGVEAPVAGVTLTDQASGAPAPNVDPSTLVADGEFFGQSATKATKALMAKLGRTRPLKTNEIFDAIMKGGVRIANVEVLYKSLARSDDFLRVAKGTWGLAEWYPERMRRVAKGDELPDEADELGGSGESGNPQEPADSIGVQT